MEPTANMEQLAASFVTQYYEGLLLQPKSLAACYGPDSTMAIAYGNGENSVGTGPKEVEQLMLTLSADLPETKKLQVSDTQIFSSFDNSSLIIIDGFVLSEDARQDFTHTVLLRGNGVEGEFYIRNDIWRFSAPVSTVAPVVAAAPAQAAVAEETAEEAVEEAAAEEEVEETCSEVTEATEDGEAAAESEAEEEKAESSKVSQTPSEADASTPAKSPAKEVTPAKEEPKGPINWAAKARAAPSATSTAAPQRVSPPPQRVKAEDKTKKVEEKPKKEEKTEERRGGRGNRDNAKSFLVVKVRDVTDEDVKGGIPAALKSGLVSLRNTSSDNSRVFLDFTQTNALELMKDPSLRIAGKSFTVEPQKKR